MEVDVEPKPGKGPGLSITFRSPEEQHRRNQVLIALLDEWDKNGDEEEQREVMRVLREALGEDRIG